ncbi:MAG: SGNH/GDSL hydrolase family protein [Planctomycetota bacterium]|jgi:hypothetical protein
MENEEKSGAGEITEVNPETPAPPRHRRFLFRTVSLLLGVLAALLLAEGGLRLFGIQPPVRRTKRVLTRGNLTFHCYPTNPHEAFRPLPEVSAGDWKLFTFMIPPTPLPLEKLQETPWCVEYRYSRVGFRDREYPQNPRPGVHRIVGIGDSFAMGEGVPLSRTLFKWMEALAPRTEIISAAMSGADFAQELEALPRIASDFRANRALVVFIANDIAMTGALADRQAYINDLINIRDEHLRAHESKAWYAGTPRILQLVGSTLEMGRVTRATIRWYLDAYDPKHNAENLEALAEGFRRLATLRDCRAVLVLYPLMEGLRSGYPLQPIHDSVMKMAETAGLPALDLAPTFRGRNPASMQVHPTDHHPNGRAHGIAAKAILEWLRRDVPGFLPAERSASEK